MPEANNPTPVTIERRGNAVVARVQFESMDHDDLKAMRRLIEQAVAPSEVAVVVVDLSAIDSFRSQELGTIVQIANACTTRRQRFRVAAATPRMREIFAITHLDKVLTLADSVEAAVAS